jgi:uncharacterized protein YkwD
MVMSSHFWRSLLTILLTLCLFLMSVPAHAAERSRYFSETGFLVENALLAAFERYGDVPVIGLPISDAMETTCEQHPCTVQWFERSRIEFHDDGQAYRGRIGADFLAARGTPWQFGTGSGAPGCRLFSETGYALCDVFLDGWQRYGGMERLGLPISPIQEETYLDAGTGQPATYRTQWFERAALEDHGAHGVMLRLLGSQTYPAWAEHLLADLINVERAQAGLRALAWDERLAQAARGHSLDLARHNGRGHIGSNGRNPIERTQSLGLAGFFGGEIVTYDQSPVAAVQSFLHSPEHKDFRLFRVCRERAHI